MAQKRIEWIYLHRAKCFASRQIMSRVSCNFAEIGFDFQIIPIQQICKNLESRMKIL